jgi:hypothetical protein
MRHKTMAAAVGAAALLVGPLAMPAAAESYSAWCAVNWAGANNCTADGNGKSAAWALYEDDPDRFSITDDLADGHSAIVEYWPDGKPGQKKRLWVRSGKGTSNQRTVSGLPENALYKMRACIGEWADDPANRVILDCGNATSVRL